MSSGLLDLQFWTSFFRTILVLDEDLDQGGESPLVTTVNIRLKSMFLELANSRASWDIN